MNYNKKYKLSFSPLKINNVNISNRLIFPAFSFNYANNDGTVSDKLIDFYDKISIEGPGLIITGGAACTAKSIGFPNGFRIYHDNFIPCIKKMFDVIKKNGSIPGIQLLAFGRQGLDSTKSLVAPSPIPCLETKKTYEEIGIEYRVKEMTLEDINAVKNDYIESGIRAYKAGAVLIELNAAHGYFLNQFLSPYSNIRKDSYGGNTVNRVRLIKEIIKGIKNKIDKNIIISVRVSGNEFVDGGLTSADFKEIIPIMESAGMDLLNVSVSIAESAKVLYPNIYTNGKEQKPGEAYYIDIAAELKKYANVPVAYCGFVSSIETAENILNTGKSDLVALGRAQFADPHLVKKTKNNKEQDIKKCIYDDKCLFFMTGDKEAYCTVNPDYKKP